MKIRIILPLFVLAATVNSTFGQTLFSENFDTDVTANWTVRRSHSDAPVDFFFDYSTIGVPPAPNGSGTTRGLRFLCNQSAGVQQGVVAYPLLYPNYQGFTGDYRLRFDMWLNFLGPGPGGGSGSTQVGSFGIGATGGSALWAGNSPNGVMFGTTGEGGSTIDYRVYYNNLLRPPGDGVYAAGTHSTAYNNTDSYYSVFGNEPVPAAQTALYPADQTGSSAIGAVGWKWRDVVIEKAGTNITWTIDGVLLGSANASIVTNFSTNIFFGMFDINATVSTNQYDFLIASIYDNVRVESLAAATQVAVVGTADAFEGGAAGAFTFSRTDGTGSLTLNYTVAGTATSGSDFTALPGSVTFNAGETNKTVSVVALEDETVEPLETVSVTIAVGAGYTISASTASISVRDNETPVVQIHAIQSRLLEVCAPARATYRVSRLGNIDTSITVNVEYSGVAVAGVDHDGPATITLTNTAQNAILSVPPIDDSAIEGSETATITLVSGTGYSVGTTNTATMTVIDDDYTSGSVLFSDNFDDALASDLTWARNAVDDTYIDYGWDYLAGAGIPKAPRTSDNTTLGVRFRANELYGAVTGGSISPNGQSFTGDYRLTFDLWLNVPGPLNASTNPGSTHAFNAGIGTDGGPNYPGSFPEPTGVWFSATGEGGSATDYIAYVGTNVMAANSGVYAAGTATTSRDHNNAHYSVWGGFAAPAEQVALYPNQINSTITGTLGIAWHKVVITKVGQVVTWTIDGLPMATVTNAVSGNIFVGYHDPFASITAAPDTTFALVDNLKVETYVAAPVSTTLNFSKSGNTLTLTWSGSFILEQASALTGSPSDWSTVNGATSPHNVDVSSGVKFYRLKSQ